MNKQKMDLPPSLIPREYKPVVKRSLVVSTIVEESAPPVEERVPPVEETQADDGAPQVEEKETSSPQNDEVVVDLLKTKTLKELRSMCTDKGLDYGGLKKHELVTLLNE